MSDISIIYLVEQDANVQQRFEEAAERLGCRVHPGASLDGAASDICALCPDVAVLPAPADAAVGVKSKRGEAAHPAGPGMLWHGLFGDANWHCASILLLDEMPVNAAWPLYGPDDFLLRHADTFEITARIQAALRLARMRRQMASAQTILQRHDDEDANGGYSEDATTHLVEIAAELQAEVCHSAAREEASVRVAQSDTIAQAAAALRHEINNPLFAILGSGESALRRLRGMRARLESVPASLPTGSELVGDLTALIAGLERIQRGGERIEQVVQTISAMLTPDTTDYVQGVSMLNLTTHKSATAEQT